MCSVRKIGIIVGSIFIGFPLAILVILLSVGTCLYFSADFQQPEIPVDLNQYELTVNSDSLKVCKQGRFYLNQYGLWEAKLMGSPVERGAAYGVMSKKQLEYQEDVFVNQIQQIITSDSWLWFLHKVVAIFNRNMAKYIPREFEEEIYAMSLSCTGKYDVYGSPYVRQLNYHAAHDIGHAMQEYMLVGCSAFAVWGEKSESRDLIVGRNFDFYVGDDFARNKVILFVEPQDGYKFVSVAWPGMMGVVSGMNEKGLTVTINAAKGALPLSSALPISLLARQILQYASDIGEAYSIAQQAYTFVSESILIGSTNDGGAAIIEKTPQKIALYRPLGSELICTNHYQSDLFREDEHNVEDIVTSDSPYRYERLQELLQEKEPLSIGDAVAILRNRYGKGNEDIGLCNEKSINQFIAHHSIVFQPGELRMWVSTAPWQLGEYVCYDLDDVFDRDLGNESISYSLAERNVPADSVSLTHEYVRVCKYRKQYGAIHHAIDDCKRLPATFIDEYIDNNPNYFQVYNSIGDYMERFGKKDSAEIFWQKALLLEIPREQERSEIYNKIKQYD